MNTSPTVTAPASAGAVARTPCTSHRYRPNVRGMATTAPTRRIICRPGDKATRQAMRTAHNDGRHGDGTNADVLAHWAAICVDCSARWRYEKELGL